MRLLQALGMGEVQAVREKGCAFVFLDVVLELVDVRELDLELVVVVFDVQEFVPGNLLGDHVLQLLTVRGQFRTVVAEILPPGSALPGVLGGVCLYHGKKFLV